jgi:hypothetical protein
MKRHADIELGHSAYTDNSSVEKKVALRKAATDGIGPLRVLDLFAGENKIWNCIETERYYGIEKEHGKGKNLHVDNRRVIAALDLSGFNVIDCDAYGIPYEQVEMLFENPTLKSGTVIIFTCITGVLNRLCVRTVNDYGIKKEYKRSRVLYNRYSSDMFFGMLYRHGIRTVHSYTVKDQMRKEYGWFVVP